MTVREKDLLPISLRDYVESRGNRLCDYDFHAVYHDEHLDLCGTGNRLKDRNDVDRFLDKVPGKAEAVVKYERKVLTTTESAGLRDEGIGLSFSTFQSGIAIIPKEKQ